MCLPPSAQAFWAVTGVGVAGALAVGVVGEQPMPATRQAMTSSFPDSIEFFFMGLRFKKFDESKKVGVFTAAHWEFSFQVLLVARLV